MKRGRRNLLIVLGCAVVAVVTWVAWPGEKEPEYQGRRLSQYLKVLFNATKPTADARDAEQAILQLGTNSLPCLVRWTECGPWQERFLVYLGRLPKPAQRMLPGRVGAYLMRKGFEPSCRELARFGFETLRGRAGPAVPELARILNDVNSTPIQRAAAMRALACIGEAGLAPLITAIGNPQMAKLKVGSGDFNLVKPPEYFICDMIALGTNAALAVPLAITWLSREPLLASRAANVLGWWGAEPGLSVPALANCVHSPNEFLRLQAVGSLGRFGERGKPAVPVLLQALSDRDHFVRAQATNALKQIAPEVLTNGVAR